MWREARVLDREWQRLNQCFLKIIRAPSSGEAAEKVPFPCIAIIFMQNSDVSIGFRDLSKSHFVHKN